MAEQPIFKINGVDFLPFIVAEGVKFEEFDLDSPNSGRTTLDGKMHRARVATKTKVTITCKQGLTGEQVHLILNTLHPLFVSVETNKHPRLGHVTLIMYTNNIGTDISHFLPDSTAIYKGFSFPLIEQ